MQRRIKEVSTTIRNVDGGLNNCRCADLLQAYAESPGAVRPIDARRLLVPQERHGIGARGEQGRPECGAYNHYRQQDCH